MTLPLNEWREVSDVFVRDDTDVSGKVKARRIRVTQRDVFGEVGLAEVMFTGETRPSIVDVRRVKDTSDWLISLTPFDDRVADNKRDYLQAFERAMGLS